MVGGLNASSACAASLRGSTWAEEDAECEGLALKLDAAKACCIDGVIRGITDETPRCSKGMEEYESSVAAIELTGLWR